VDAIAALRRLRMTAKEIAEVLGMNASKACRTASTFSCDIAREYPDSSCRSSRKAEALDDHVFSTRVRTMIMMVTL
jgi:hypothetical protein